MYELPGSRSHLPAAATGGNSLPDPRILALEAAAAGNPKDAELRHLWKSLLRRRKQLVLVFSLFVAAVVAFTVLQPRTYMTQVRLIAGQTATQGGPDAAGGNTNLPVLNALLAQNGAQSSETYAELLHESPIAQQVIADLHLQTTADVLLSRVLIRPVTNTSIISISVKWKDPVVSAKIANDFATVFVERERQLVAHQAESALGFLDKELPDAEQHMRATQNALAAYQAATGIADLTQQTQSDITQLAALDTKQQSVQLESRQAEAEIGALTAELSRTPESIQGQQNVSANPVAAQLQSQIAQTQLDLTAALQQYTDNHPTVIALKHKLSQEQRELQSQPGSVVSGTQTIPNPAYGLLQQQIATARAHLAAADSQEATIGNQRKAMAPLLDKLPQQSRRIGDLSREAKAAEGVYSALQQKYQDAIVSRSTALSPVTITQEASPDVVTVTPNVVFNILVGVFMGIVLSVSSVLIAEFFDDRYRSADDVKERLGLPVLASIPQLAPGKATSSWVQPLSVESFLQLVAALRYSSNRPPRTIAVTSPDQGDGKSTITINTAISMASMNARILIVDADLRRPTIHHKLGIANGRGLSDVLVGVAPLMDVVVPSGHENVWVLTSGRRAPNPVALLQGETFERVLKEARERFDVVLVDSPALKSIVDGVVIGIKTEGTILVVSAAKSDPRSVSTALEKLRSVRSLGALNLLGVVLNETKPDQSDYSDYYLGAGQSLSLASGSP